MTDRLQILADSYLDHIRIAVEANDRAAPFRDFFDNWNAFRSKADHHRSKGEGVRWFNNPSAFSRATMLESLDFRSVGAARILDLARVDPQAYRLAYRAKEKQTKLVIDHAVPISIIVDMLFKHPSYLNREDIRAHLVRWYRLGLLANDENTILDKAGLRSKMPDDWDNENVFARYRAVGIQTSDIGEME